MKKGIKYILYFIICVLLITTVFRNKVWENGITLNMDTVKKYPTNIRAWINLGSHYLKEEDYENAIKYSKKAIELDKKSQEGKENPRNFYPHPYYTLGKVAFKKKEYKKAYDYYEVALKQDNSYLKTYYGLVELFEKLGEIKKVVKLEEVILEKGGINKEKDLNLMLKLGKNSIKIGDKKRALEYNRKAYKIAPQNYDVLANLGVAYSINNMTVEAKKILRKTIELYPKKDKGYINLGILYYRRGNLENAIKIMEEGYKKTKSENIKVKLDRLKEKK